MDQAPSPELAADTVSLFHMMCVQALFRFAELSRKGRLPHLVSCFRVLLSGAGAGSSSDTTFGGQV